MTDWDPPETRIYHILLVRLRSMNWVIGLWSLHCVFKQCHYFREPNSTKIILLNNKFPPYYILPAYIMDYIRLKFGTKEHPKWLMILWRNKRSSKNYSMARKLHEIHFGVKWNQERLTKMVLLLWRVWQKTAAQSPLAFILGYIWLDLRPVRCIISRSCDGQIEAS